MTQRYGVFIKNDSESLEKNLANQLKREAS